MATTAFKPTPAHQLATTHSESTHDSHFASAQQEVPRGPVNAKLYFFDPPKDGSAPYNYVEKPPEGVPQRNFDAQEHDVTINDIRGQEHRFTLDTDAFQALSATATAATAASPPVDFDDEEDIKARYYPEVEKLLLANLPGSHRVFLFDHTIRRANKTGNREPVLRVHIDQTARAAAQRVRHHLPDDAETLLQGRYRIVNVWRPLNGPVVASPLAVASGISTSNGDLVGVEHRYPDRTGETAAVRFNEGQKWYYWSGMTNEERLLLKCADSDETVGAHGRVPHTAFVDPRTKEDWPGRESIEVRALVFG